MLGIVALVLAAIPGPSFVAFLPAITAAVFGIIALVKRHPRRGLAVVVVDRHRGHAEHRTKHRVSGQTRCPRCAS